MLNGLFMESKDRHESGFTLLEVIIAVGVMTVVGVATAPFVVHSADAFSEMTTRTHHSTRAQVVLDRVLHELVSGRFVTLDPPVPQDSNWIRFDRITGFSDGAPEFGDLTQIELVERDSGDRVIRLWKDVAPLGLTPGDEDTVHILTDRVAENGLQFTRTGGTVEVQMTLLIPTEQGEPDRPLTITSGVRMRNDS